MKQQVLGTYEVKIIPGRGKYVQSLTVSVPKWLKASEQVRGDAGDEIGGAT